MKLNKIALLVIVKFFLLCLLLTPQAYAERVENLYTLTGLVTDTSDEQRVIAANLLLRRLLVRVSGTHKVLAALPPEGFIETPGNYVEHPQYENWIKTSSAQELINQYSYLAHTEPTQQQLELTFDEAGVKRLLRHLKAPVWDTDRPKVLFWVALESKNGRTLITPASNEPLSQVLANQNKERGIPFLLPDFSTYPASDTLFSDIWGGFSQQIIDASSAYQPDAIVVGKIKAAGRNWQVEWQLLTGANSVNHSVSTATLREALQEGVSFTAEELSSRYASQSGQGAGTYRVMVDNIDKIQDYASINSYLNGLSLTSQVRVVQSVDQRVLYELTLRGGLDQLRANLALDGRLKEESFVGLQQTASFSKQPINTEPMRTPARQADAYFRWQAK